MLLETIKIHSIWIIFYVLTMTELPTLSHDSWWAGIKVYVWFSANWNKKIALQMLTVLDSQAHEKWLFWCTSNGWTSHHDYWQFITVIMHFCYLQQNMTPKTYSGLYWPFLATKIPERWIIFDELPIVELCTLWQNNFGQITRLLKAFLNL